jgi:hypothetical protein
VRERRGYELDQGAVEMTKKNLKKDARVKFGKSDHKNPANQVALLSSKRVIAHFTYPNFQL